MPDTVVVATKKCIVWIIVFYSIKRRLIAAGDNDHVELIRKYRYNQGQSLSLVLIDW